MEEVKSKRVTEWLKNLLHPEGGGAEYEHVNL